jgi:Flp pilus assembly protein TadB
MSDNRGWEERRDARNHAMVPATPRDVAHIRVVSFMMVFLFAFAVLGLIAHAPVITGIAVVLAIIGVIDIVLAVRRQKRGHSGEAG